MDMVKTTENGFYVVLNESEQCGNDAGGYVVSIESAQDEYGFTLFRVESPNYVEYYQEQGHAMLAFCEAIASYYEAEADDEYGFTGTGTGLSDLC